MSNTIKIKHGSRAPSVNDLYPYELGYVQNGALYINNNGGIAQLTDPRLITLITDDDYFKYKPSVSVLNTPNLTAEQVTECYWEVYNKLYTIPAILKRTIFHKRFFKRPGRTLFYLMVNMVYRSQIKRKIAPNILQCKTKHVCL